MPSVPRSRVGLAGPSGPAGPAGVAGSPGAPGATGPAGAPGAQGPAGTGIVIKGSVATVGSLPPSGNTVNDTYKVTGTGDFHSWNGASWTNIGPIEGPQGPAGAQGAAGANGATGATGPAGAAGATGATGAAGPAGTTLWAGLTDKPAVIAAGATTDEAQVNLGMSQKGRELAIASDAVAVQTAAGLTPIGKLLATAADTGSARTFIGAAPAATTVTTATAQTISGAKNFTGAVSFLPESISTDALADLAGTIAETNNATQVVHGVAYDAGDTLPTTGFWIAVERDAVSVPADITGLFGGASSADATSYSFTLTRAFAAGSYGYAFIGTGVTTGTAPPADTVSMGGVQWTLQLDALGNPMTATLANGLNSGALYRSATAPTGTTLVATTPTTVQGMVVRVVEVVGGVNTPVQARKTASTATTTPAVSFTGADAGNFSIGWILQNTLTDLTLGTGYSEIGGLVVSTAPPPTMSIKTQWRDSAINSMNFSGATAAQKIVFGVEIARAA